MTAVLVVTQGPFAGRRLELEGELVIGREDATVTIEDSELSRRHAVVRPVDGGVEIEDLGSLNGTYVNGERIAGPRRLSGGDSIKLGQTVIELEGARAAAATVASPVPAAPVATTPTPSAGTIPGEPFGAYAAPESKGRRGGIASRQLGPIIASWGAIAATAIALAIYFAEH
jgi:pSer/pThr/pTyr-binding forkhead associated (FHA) protein